MGRFVNPDNRSFEDAINSEIYIDKTALLEYTNRVMNTTSKFVCNSRPRRFGKSMTVDMMTAYYSKGCESKRLFDNLKISSAKSYEKCLNKYDVIHFDMQWFIEPDNSVNDIVDRIQRAVIIELREQYSEVSLDVNSLPEAMSLIYDKLGVRFIVIIDEWDVLIRDEASNSEIQNEYIGFLRKLFKGAEPSKYICLAYLTGILPIKKLKTQSALNNFEEFTMLDARQMAPFIGFTKAEVMNLCDEYGRDFEQVKSWYDGYLLEDYQVYNPRAVVSVMQCGKFKSYWSNTGSYEAIVPLINMDFDGLRAAIIEMLSGTSVDVDVTSFQNDTVSFANRDDVLTYLIHLGYLAYDQNRQQVLIPNEEIRHELNNAVKRGRWNEMITFQRESVSLLNATLDMDERAVAEGIERIHMEYASVIEYNNENSLSSVLSIAYLSSMQYYFKPVRELPAGRGFADFVYIPKPEYKEEYPALVVELKWNKTANSALEQIKNRKYPNSITGYTGNILLVGISYDKGTKTHKCVIEKWSLSHGKNGK